MDSAGLLLSDLAATDAAGLYVSPIAAFAPTGAVAARIGGGWAGFESVKLTVKTADAVRHGIASLDEARAWSRRQGRATAERFDRLLARITAPRPAFAGLAMDRPRIMGIVNVTPDSFSDGGDYATAEAALARARDMAAAGAEILDIGGESTRPGSDPVAPDEERRRVLPVIEGLRGAGLGAVVSIDTRKARVMTDAVAAGAHVVNDISALTFDPAALAAVARLGVPVVLMHCQGDPKTMQVQPTYRHAPTEIFDYLAARIQACEDAGVPRSRIAVDPGIGFGKGLDHNMAVIGDLALLHGLGCPVLVGLSRKSFIGRLAGVEVPRARVPGSLAAALWAVGQGMQMVRVHDVAETAQALAVWRGVSGAEA